MKKQAVIVMDQSHKSLEREQAALQQAQEALKLKESAAADAAGSAQRENYMLDLMTDASQDMAGMLTLSSSFFCCCFSVLLYCFPWYLLGAFLDTAAEEERVNLRVGALLRLAKANDINFWANEDHTRRIVQFQDLTAQVREFLDFCTSTLAMVYNTMFPRNPQPDNLPELMGKFKDVHNIHDFVKAQMIAGAKLALIWLKICHSKMEFGRIIDIFHSKVSKRRRNIDKLNVEVSPIAEKMIEELLRVDTAFFKEFRYADSTQNFHAAGDNINIDNLI